MARGRGANKRREDGKVKGVGPPSRDLAAAGSNPAGRGKGLRRLQKSTPRNELKSGFTLCKRRWSKKRRRFGRPGFKHGLPRHEGAALASRRATERMTSCSRVRRRPIGSASLPCLCVLPLLRPLPCPAPCPGSRPALLRSGQHIADIHLMGVTAQHHGRARYGVVPQSSLIVSSWLKPFGPAALCVSPSTSGDLRGPG